LDEWEEHKLHGRKRKWFDLNEAKSELEKHKPVQGSYLNLLKGYESIPATNIDYFATNGHMNSINNININTSTDNQPKHNDFNSPQLHYNGNLFISALSVAAAAANGPSLYSYNLSGSHLEHEKILPQPTSVATNTIWKFFVVWLF